jgi:hypothetical protein
MTDSDSERAPTGQALVASDGAPSGLHPSGFDPSRVRQLLDAVAPICLVIADYVTHAGPTYEPHERVLGRIARGAETAPYVTWGQLCAIDEAAYALAGGTEAAEFALDAIAMETGTAIDSEAGVVAKP